MDKIANRDDLNTAIGLIGKYQTLITKYQGLQGKYRDMVVRYLELKNMKSFTTDDGDTWQKRQGTNIQYQLDDLRRLLRRKHIDSAEIIKVHTVEEIDEDELMKLMQKGVITIEEYEAVAIRHTFKPYVVKLRGTRRIETSPFPIRLGRQDQREYRHDSASRREEFRKAGHRRGNRATA